MNKYLHNLLIAGAMSAMTLVSLPAHAADPITSLITSIMGSGLSFGGGGQFVNGDPANQVIPLLQQIYRQNADNGGVDNNGKRLQTETAMQLTQYSEQNQWERERRLRDDEIVRSYSEMSNLSCAIATANQSAGIIETAAGNTTGQVVDLLTGGMYKSVMLNTELSAANKAKIWCKLGSTGRNGVCDVDYDPLIRGAEEGRYKAITIKDSIPCDMQSVQQEFQQMRNPDSWTPNQRNKECIAAILAIANEYPVSNSLPTREEARTVNGSRVWDMKINQIAMAAGSKAPIFVEFEERVSVPESNGCSRGINAGGRSVYQLLREAYGDVSRQSGKPNFGLPPSGFCISKLQLGYGSQLMLEEGLRDSGGQNDGRVLQNIFAATTLTARHDYEMRRRVHPTSFVKTMDNTIVDRSVQSSLDNDHQRELLGAIRLLTSEIRKMNEGVYAGKLREASAKGRQKEDQIVKATADISDALKDMGLKVSSPSSAVLGPITPEFPVLPPQ